MIDDTMTEQELMDMLMQMMLDHYPYCEENFHDTGNVAKNTGYFALGGSNSNEGLRCSHNYALLCAFLYRELPESDYPSDGSFKQKLKEMAIKAIRYGVFTHNSVKMMTCAADGGHWGPPFWQSSLQSHKLLFCAHLMWEYLDPEMRRLVETVAAAEGDRGANTPPKQYSPGDTGSEENSWDTCAPAIAYNMFPNHERAETWREASIKFALNTLSRKADMEDFTVVDKKPARERITTWNLFDDYSLENHNIMHPLYQSAAYTYFPDSMFYYIYFGHKVPEAFWHNVQKTFDAVLKKLVLPGGEWIYVNGCDWDLMLPGCIEPIAYMATVFKDPGAKLLEKRSLQFSRKRQKQGGSGRLVPASPLGVVREGVEIGRIIFTYLLHKYVASWPTEDISWESFIGENATTATFLEDAVISNHNQNRFASFSWKKKFMGLLTPSNEGRLDEGYITHPNLPNIVGSIETKESPKSREYGRHINYKNKDSFSTIGYFDENGGLIQRYMSLTALPCNAGIIMESIRAKSDVTVTKNHVLPLSFQTDAFTATKKKTLTTEARADSFEANCETNKTYFGDWIDIDGHTFVALDKKRAIMFGDHAVSSAVEGATLKFAADTGTYGAKATISKTAAVVFFNMATEAARHKKNKIRHFEMPEGWQGMSVEDADGKCYYSISNFYGGDGICKIRGEYGAPVIAQTSSVTGDEATLRLVAGEMKSDYAQIKKYVKTLEGKTLMVSVADDNKSEIRLINKNTEAVRAELTLVAENAEDEPTTSHFFVEPGKSYVLR
ncbi:MAG: hypothetical protein FWH48_09555, partial [Oscillospiraceae bacterium]|nr:hypothetical protein [Oscillospiraceae bacterium]